MLYGIDLDSSTSQLFDNINATPEPPFRGNTNSPALLAHNEALRQHQEALQREQAIQRQRDAANNANNSALLGVRKVASGTLGSPFKDGQAQTGTQVHGLAATAAANAAAAAGAAQSQNTVPIVKKPVPRVRSGTASATNSEAGKGRPDSKAKQAFPSKLDTSMNSSNTTLAGASGNNARARNEAARSKKPPSSNNRYLTGAAANRARKTSDASEKSIRKDDLLDRLADALKYVDIRVRYACCLLGLIG